MFHMDIKPQNILNNLLNRIKIQGYGILPSYKNDLLNCLKERLIYMSPEYRQCIQIKNNFDYEKSDIFSIGIVVLRM